ncbi:NAD-dependent epimerase/dehydratase family protein [Sanyastnella coralliicola]|uniref:NAD-dependent epimerase/dehydratase family protein n=1 Tax=Sanyastnella coralliicola TaxID=3069118 RepID=UPI0027B8A1BB|nr:NAD-dependent epimerase/dehydratase family protein [Longitalea sp. SCSIO 12813]
MNLITGGTGLVGMHFIAALLKDKQEVRALIRKGADLTSVESFLRYQQLDPKSVDWVEGDILDVPSLMDAMEGVSRVIHAAALVSFHRKDRDLLYQVNVEGTANMVNVAMSAEIGEFVYISSVAALGRQDGALEVHEETEWKDDPELSHYARSKHMAEREVWRGSEEGLKVFVVNPGIIIGIGDFDRSSAEVFKQVDKGMPYYPGGSNGFVAVQDVIAASMHLIEHDHSNERYLLVGEHLKYQELFEQVGASIGAKVPSKEAPLWLMNTVRILSSIGERLTGKRAFITKENVKSASSNYRYLNDRMLSTSFKFTPLKGVIEETGKYYRSLSES